MASGSDLLSDRRHFVKTAALTTGAFMAGPLFSRSTRPDIDYEYMDLHVHTARSFGMDRIMQRRFKDVSRVTWLLCFSLTIRNTFLKLPLWLDRFESNMKVLFTT
ncbi:MAG: hypothetical protein H8D67_31445 [Deltaproteobacteria bacterium]|nr:hypothetical protein [Deltaproteobacteria bacterium]